MTAVYQFIALDALVPGQYQPRLDFDEQALSDLAQSICTQGLLEPLIVRQPVEGLYEILAGERRWRAARLAGLSEVPCLLGHYTDEQAATLSLVENVQRENLNLIEEARGYRRLLDEFNFQQHEVASLVGKSRSYIANLLRLLKLAQPVQALLRQGSLTLGHARHLVALKPNEQIALAEQISAQNWSVRRLESYLKNKKPTPNSPRSPTCDRDVARLQTILAEQLGTPVQIDSDNEPGGWLRIKFYDNDTLAGLLERMQLQVEAEDAL